MSQGKKSDWNVKYFKVHRYVQSVHSSRPNSRCNHSRALPLRRGPYLMSDWKFSQYWAFLDVGMI